MLIGYDFVVTQLRYVRAAMGEIASFTPDGLNATQVQNLIDSAAPVRTSYITGKVTLDGARATRRLSISKLHDACVAFLQQARVTFRKDVNVMERLDRLPTEDHSFQETLTRADNTLALWAQLPKIGTPPESFQVTQVDAPLTTAGLTALRAAAEAANEAIPMIDQEFQKAEADLHDKEAELKDRVNAALALGRSQFPEGTPERGIIAAIPTESPRNLPGKATISSATQNAPGTVTLVYECAGATSYDVFIKRPGFSEFELLAEDVITPKYEAGSLDLPAEPTPYLFYVRGRNSRGIGPDSDTVSVELV